MAIMYSWDQIYIRNIKYPNSPVVQLGFFLVQFIHANIGMTGVWALP